MKKYLLLTFGILFVYKFILALQGFDLTDEGFVLTFYQQIFCAPETVEYQFLYYLSSLVGGAWNILFGFGGILSFRVLAIVVDLLTIYITCLTIKKYVQSQPKLILFAALFAILYHFGTTVFHHNQLTALLVAGSVYFILKGLNVENKSHRPLFWGAFLCGINIFTRIPNVTMIGLGLLLFVDYYYEKNSIRLWKNMGYSFLGLISGILMVLFVMFLCGHLEIFRQSVMNNLLDAGIGDGTHNALNLVKAYVINYKNIYTYLSIFVFTTFFFLFIYNQSKKKRFRFFSIVSYLALFFVFIAIFDLNNEKYYSLILFPILVSCCVDRSNKSLMLLNIASLLIMFLLPLGTESGIRNIGGSCVWLGTFVSAIHVFRYIRYRIMFKRDESCRIFFKAAYILYFVTCLFYVSRLAYFDSGSRLEKRYRADNDKFTVFTVKDKAEAINVLLTSLNKYVKKGDYLLCFESLPMIHYLTETKPYIGISWVWCYSSENFKKHLDQAAVTLPLPVILKQKCQPIGGGWTIPDGPADKNFDSNPGLYNLKRIEYFEKFIRDNHYKIAWENDLFSIYIIE